MSSPQGRSVVFTLRVAGVLALLLPPLCLRLRFVHGETEAFDLVRRCAQRVLRWSGVRVRVANLEYLPAGTAAMLVTNHVSIADAAVLLGCLPFDFRFVANHVFAGYPLLGAAIRGASANVVDRGSWRSRADSAQAMIDTLVAGRTLLVFPEGTTADTGVMLPFRTGAFRAAARTGSPVVPVALSGTRNLMPSNSWWMANVPLDVVLLPPMTSRDATRDAVAELRDRAATAIREQLAL